MSRKYGWGFAASAIALLLAGLSTAAAERTLEGVKVERVVDGDTVVIRYAGPEGAQEDRLRFDGIDTPESDQPHGQEAASALRGRLRGAGKVSAVVEEDRGPYGRLIGGLHVDGQALNAWLVERGHAWVYHRYNDDPSLVDAEQDAREQGRGLWRAEDPVPPWEWRRR